MTNVRPDELNYDHYAEDKYDRDIVNSIPGHEEMHKRIEEIAQRDFRGKGLRVLELGIGTGLTSFRLLSKLDSPEYFAVDFSETMLNHARKNLAEYAVEFFLGDYSKIALPKENDLIVSVIGIHHQETDRDKQELFRRIYDHLSERGSFIFGDLVTYRDKNTAALNDALHYHHLVEKSSDEKTLQEWAYHHKYLNKLAPLEDQVEWLKELGFKNVKVEFQKFNTTLIIANKS